MNSRIGQCADLQRNITCPKVEGEAWRRKVRCGHPGRNTNPARLRVASRVMQPCADGGGQGHQGGPTGPERSR